MPLGTPERTLRAGQAEGSRMFNYTQIDGSKIEYVEIAPADELPNGERMFVEVEGRPIVIFNIGGQYFAIADVCSHDEGPVGEGDLDGYQITCPRHGAQFDVRSGGVTQMPAVVDIPAYPVRVVDGTIQLGIPKE
ncbi:MAG TPA: non-heme iron oxygenase ferredoxin subunit [Anaerolineales bacterium]|nr:non-heme iron oxygenase ferredoxin subunit [Anaerolineales bacterium]